MSRSWNGAAKTAALVGLGVGLGTFALGPLLHQIGHRDDHVHIGGTIVYDQTAAPLAEGRTSSEHGTPEDRDPASNPSGPHGAGSSLHFGPVLTQSAEPTALEEPEGSSSLPPSPSRAIATPSSVCESHCARDPPAID
ncbi:MAG: hypothetical protein ACFB9M_09465 [Myxococcota bacterium]